MNLSYYNITINPLGLNGAERWRYVAQVHEHLKWIYRTKSGRLLLNCIRRPNFPIEIRPYTGGKCNATGGSELKAGAAALTGVVTYTPGTFSQKAGSACLVEHGANDRGRLWDEILFHELVHVFRTATGTWKPDRPLSIGMNHYTNNEEFIAVMCSNIYIADRTNKIKSGLRAGHKGFSAMSAEDAMRFGLFASSKAAFGLVKQFCADHPIFSKALNEQLADAEYNPVADFYRFPKVCEFFSLVGAHKDKSKLAGFLRSLGFPVTVAEEVAVRVAFAP